MLPSSVELVFWLILGLILIWDLLLYFDKVPKNSISQTIIAADGRSKLFGRLLWGAWFFLLGHWYV